jgi:hypothetical protein
MGCRILAFMNSFSSRLLALTVFCSVVAAASFVHIGAETSVTVHQPDDQSGVAFSMRLSVGASPLAQSAFSRLHASLAGSDRGSARIEDIGAAPDTPRSSSKCQVC